jgi:hypothetical protein
MANNGDCTKNSSYMLANCYKACTSCYKPNRIGSSVFPGQILEENAAYSVILPYAFTDTSVIRQFSAYFASLEPVYLQVWRPNGTNVFNLVFNEIAYPTAANQSQAILMKWCIVVNAGDRIGFTSFNGPAPVAYRQARPGYYYPTALRNAASTGQFFTINVPYEYSFSADFYYGSTC